MRLEKTKRELAKNTKQKNSNVTSELTCHVFRKPKLNQFLSPSAGRGIFFLGQNTHLGISSRKMAGLVAFFFELNGSFKIRHRVAYYRLWLFLGSHPHLWKLGSGPVLEIFSLVYNPGIEITLPCI